MTALVFILILSLLVIIHELGHFFFARKNKIRVEEFGLGYPPRLLTLFSWKGTKFSLNAIPFGGFVKMEGEDENPSEESSKPAKDDLGPFYTKSPSQRLSVILAGPMTNFLFGVVAFTILFSILGIPTPLNGQARIAEVVADSPAALAGVPKEVNIIGFKAGEEQVQVTDIAEIQAYVEEHRGQTVTIQTTGPCQEDRCAESLQEYPVYLRTQAETPDNQGSMGIIFADIFLKRYPWYEMPFRGIVYGLNQAVMLGAFILSTLGSLISQIISGGGVREDLAGPIGIVHQASQNNLLGQGWEALLSFAGMLSVNLAIMNLLPIPALDGGRAFFIILESFLGKKSVTKVEGYANYFGYFFLLFLILLISAKDIWRIITG